MTTTILTPPVFRALVLINPFGGTGDARKLFDEVALPIMREADMEVITMETRWKGHAREVAKRMTDAYLEKLSVIVVCGGDGVVHEVRGLMQMLH